MGDAGVKERRRSGPGSRRLSAAGTVLLVLVAGSAGAAILLSTPRAVPPREMPSLPLDRDAIERVVNADRRQAEELADSPELDDLESLYRELGHAETATGELESEAQARSAALRQAFAALQQSEGDDVGPRLLSRWTERASSDSADPELLGSFATVLERYGVPSEGGDVVIRFVRRTLYKARVNAAVMRPPTADFEPVELQAYWGWLAYGADDIEPVRRLTALSAFEDAGGRVDDEARGTLRYLAGDMLGAAEAFERAYDESGSLRLRNHALAATTAAEP